MKNLCGICGIVLAFFISSVTYSMSSSKDVCFGLFENEMSVFAVGPHAPEPPPLQTMQIKTRRWSLGIESGAIAYSGDIDNNSMFSDAGNTWSAYASLLYKYRLYTQNRQYYSLLLRSHIGIYPLKASSKNYSFTNTSFGGGVGLEAEFFLRSKFRPYFYIGIGILSFLPNTSYTEFFGNKHPEQFRGSSTVTGMFPAGAGFNYQVGRQIDLNFQISKTLTMSDNLDGWESGIMDNFQTIGLGILFYFR